MSVSHPRVWTSWIPAALHATLIWALSSMSHPDFAPVHWLPFHDKGAHFLVFSVFALFFAYGALRTWPKWPLVRVFALAMVATVVWGALDEGHQFFVPGRDSDVFDLFADALGGAAGAGLCVGLAALRLAKLRHVRDTSAR